MKTITASLLTLGLAAAMGISTRDVIGDHGQPGAPARTESVPITPPSVPAAPPSNLPTPSTGIPTQAAPPLVSSDTRCGVNRPQCRGSLCTLPRPDRIQATAAEVAAELHFLALTLAEDIDFDLHGTCNYTHLIRAAEFIVGDVISVRRALARHQPAEVVAADIRNAAASLEHLERSIGRRYRTRAIHFDLLDARAALDDLAMSLGVDPRQKEAEQRQIPAVPQRQPDDPATGRLTVPPLPPRSTPPLLPPALRSGSARPSAQPEVLVVPELTDEPAIPETMKGIRQLSLSDQRMAMKQQTCPITSDLLGSMGRPIKVDVDGRIVFVCCEGCVEKLRSSSR